MSSGRRRRRTAFLALASVTIAAGLVVHWRGKALDPVARDVLGDALWAMMIAWWAGMLAPRAPLAVRSAAAYVLCVAVELSQLYHTPALDAARGTVVGRLTLGTGFDPRDLAAYAAGVALAALLESISGSQAGRRSSGHEVGPGSGGNSGAARR